MQRSICPLPLKAQRVMIPRTYEIYALFSFGLSPSSPRGFMGMRKNMNNIYIYSIFKRAFTYHSLQQMQYGTKIKALTLMLSDNVIYCILSLLFHYLSVLCIRQVFIFLNNYIYPLHTCVAISIIFPNQVFDWQFSYSLCKLCCTRLGQFAPSHK